ncbi:hypothetical protein [Rathayibacter iranicus]|uniref:Uncharacterized protein n=1 Tax=Rathayibacter iranicus NCPPB 2253 = VKM Ac-1602 TaxID=1328868 RepID=A0ABX5L9T6_9MICO|nr:hypothetical protein [Rathayibacter iranicus]MWV32255.1 hypothetical protein [Rathayibacter iranicus NCPPB 2253 = VKM Ac-1602]PWJ60806.1 hypothetical protein B0H03_1245 [Rathayibacter iranicus NCPPB 2253 = VKM Ac-1602]
MIEARQRLVSADYGVKVIAFALSETRIAGRWQQSYDGALACADEFGSALMALVARFPDSSLGVDAIGSVTGFATIEDEDVAAGVPVQLLSIGGRGKLSGDDR